MRLAVTCLLPALFLGTLRAQNTNEPAAPQTTAPPDAAKIVQQQFGPTCELANERSAVHTNYVQQKKEVWVNFLSGDFDGDGVPDAAIVARCSSPLAGEVQYNYKVEDPYFAANGYGNPHVTANFSSGDPEHQNVVLVILGAGADGWKAATPKAKFLLINLPFDNLQAMEVLPKKKAKPVAAIFLAEKEGAGSSVFYDGKKWRWRDMGQ
jgi:hypothetical protein